MELSDILFSAVEIVGTVSFAVSGAMIAIQRRLDLFGVVALGMLTAFGGGVTRDVLLGSIPPRCFYSFHLLLAAFFASLAVFVVAYLFRRHYFRSETVIDNINNFIDAVGLAAFTVSGVQTAITAGHYGNPAFCVFLGMLTGVGGGILRDVVSITMPLIFRKRVYATASILGGAVYYLCLYLRLPDTLSVILCMLAIIAVRVCATVFHWNLPKVEAPETGVSGGRE